MEGSSFGDAGGWVRTGRRRSDAGYAVALDGTRQEGWRDNSSYLLGNGSLAGWRRVGAGRLEGGVLLYGSGWDSPGFVSVERYNEGDLEAATDPTDGGEAARLVAHGRYSQPVDANTTLDATLWGQGVRSKVYLNIPEDGQVSQTEEEDRRVAFGGQAMLARHMGGGELDVGVSGRGDWTNYDLYNTIARTARRPGAGGRRRLPERRPVRALARADRQPDRVRRRRPAGPGALLVAGSARSRRRAAERDPDARQPEARGALSARAAGSRCWPT